MTAYDYFVEKADVFLQHCDEDKKEQILAGIRSYFEDMNAPKDEDASHAATKEWIHNFFFYRVEDKPMPVRDMFRLHLMDTGTIPVTDAPSIADREWLRFSHFKEATFFTFFLYYNTIAYLQQIKAYGEAYAISRYRCGYKLPMEQYREVSYLYLSAMNALPPEHERGTHLRRVFSCIPRDLMYAAGLSRYIRPDLVEKAMSTGSADLFIYLAAPFISLSDLGEREKILDGIRFYFDNAPNAQDPTFAKKEWDFFISYKEDRFLSFFLTLAEIKEILAYCESLALSRYHDGNMITLHENRDIADEIIVRINTFIADKRHLPLFNSLLSQGVSDLFYACGINNEIRPELLRDPSAPS